MRTDTATSSPVQDHHQAQHEEHGDDDDRNKGDKNDDGTDHADKDDSHKLANVSRFKLKRQPQIMGSGR